MRAKLPVGSPGVYDRPRTMPKPPSDATSSTLVQPWTKVRIWLGAAPLAGYAVFHAWMLLPALDSREAWLEGATHLRLDTVGWALALAAFAAHVALWVVTLIQRFRLRGKQRDPWLGFEAWMLVLFTGFVVRHLAVLGPRAAPREAGMRAAYDLLWTMLGTPVELVIYAAGITALAFHLGMNVARVLEAHVGRPRAARYVAGALTVLLWLAFAQVLGRFATGEALIPALSAAPEADSEAP